MAARGSLESRHALPRTKSRPISTGGRSPRPQRSGLPQPGLLPLAAQKLPGGSRQEPHLPQTMPQSPVVGGQHTLLRSLWSGPTLTGSLRGSPPTPVLTEHMGGTPNPRRSPGPPGFSTDQPNLRVQSCAYYLLQCDPSTSDTPCTWGGLGATHHCFLSSARTATSRLSELDCTHISPRRSHYPERKP